MDAHTGGSGMRLLLLEQAMGFGPARLVMAPASVAGARLDPLGSPRRRGRRRARGVRRRAARRRISALLRLRIRRPAARRRFPGLLRRRAYGLRFPGILQRFVVLGGGRPRHGLLQSGHGDQQARLHHRGRRSASSTTGRRGRGVVAIRAAPGDPHPLDDDASGPDAAATEPAYLLSAADLRSKRDIADWVWLARLQTMFEVAFDAGLLRSGRDLRRVLQAIGDIDITAPCPPCTRELCLDCISSIVGEEKLLLANPPPPPPPGPRG
ncbi:unnamed protein product [Urochloa humidicola]